jgi:hypothetical protein
LNDFADSIRSLGFAGISGKDSDMATGSQQISKKVSAEHPCGARKENPPRHRRHEIFLASLRRLFRQANFFHNGIFREGRMVRLNEEPGKAVLFS